MSGEYGSAEMRGHTFLFDKKDTFITQKRYLTKTYISSILKYNELSSLKGNNAMENDDTADLKKRVDNFLIESTLRIFNETRYDKFLHYSKKKTQGHRDRVGWVPLNRSEYFWNSYDVKGDNSANHIHYACKAFATSKTEVTEVHEDEFEDSFTPYSHHTYIELSHTSCECGYYTDRNLRIEGEAGSLIWRFLNAS